ncbi:flagellin [Candidatus Clostridium radicumherbarum]|uniref:Flagellin n=1 Tax=Candidatus Clostridium radicumherbarum TaxID=3381662 RepID=A0ABW8TVA5_9CLOT
MRLLHNLASLNIYNEQTKALQRQSVALGRISSGVKVNSAKDDPIAISQSERLRMQIRGLQMASKNTQDGMSMMQTAEGALGSITDALQRIRELTVQAGSGSNSLQDNANIKTEIDQMLKTVNDAAENMEFNGVKLLANSSTTISMATGANVGDKVDIPLFNLALYKPDGSIDGTSNISSLTGINVTTNSTANDISVIDDAIKNVLSISSKYGSLENRFESTYSNLNELSDRMEGADSNLRDADIADEMMEYSKDSILSEAGTALMAQTNKLPQDVLRILQNMK